MSASTAGAGSAGEITEVAISRRFARMMALRGADRRR
jgi:hypothetical protein